MDMYDSALLGILQNEGQIHPFLETIFGFLYRKTDFYRILDKNQGKLGFPAGVAEKMVLKAFRKFRQQSVADEQHRMSRELDLDAPHAVEVVDVVSETKDAAEEVVVESEKEIPGDLKNVSKASVTDSDCYNGAVCGNYSWAQTIRDLDVRVGVPEEVRKAKEVKVDMGRNRLNVQIAAEPGKWETVINGDLSWRINQNESMWTLVPGECININLEKSEERWWDSLMVHESKIDLRDIDGCRPVEDLDEEEQTKIQELVFDEQQKQLGKPTIEQMKMESMLREAWDKEGSPFRGQPFDPSVVNLAGSSHFPNSG